MTMTYKNKLALFSVLMLFTIISVVGTNSAWAQPDYMTQLKKTYGEIEIIQEDINNIQNEVNKLEKTPTAQQNAIIKQSIQQLKDTLNKKVIAMHELDKEFMRLEQLHKELYKVDPETEKHLYSVKNMIYDKYVDPSSKSYVGDNSVTFVTVDFPHKGIIVKFDPDQVAKQDLRSDKTPADILADIQSLIGKDIPISVEYAKAELIACTSRTLVCDPIKGGVQIADITNLPANATLGWKSTDTQGNVGFVTAGHVSGPVGKTVEQPLNNRDVGTVTKYCRSPTSPPSVAGNTCDYSFVDLFNGIGITNDAIFRTSTASWIITNRVADTSQGVGTVIWKSGVTTGNTMGTITENDPTKNYTIVELSVQGGDSGSPVFRQPSTLQNYVDLYGVLYKKLGTHAAYHPWDKVKNQLGLVE